MFCMSLTDWPEGQAATCVRGGATNSKRNCRCCYHLTKDFSNTEDGVCYDMRNEADIRMRSEYHLDQMSRRVKGAFGEAETEGKNLSMWWLRSAMWNMNSYTDDSGYFMQFPFDTLHTVSNGIVKNLREILEVLALKYGTVAELDLRLASIPPVRDPLQRNFSYRPFPSGISSMQKYTGTDHIALIQMMHFVVSKDEGVIRDASVREAFVSACTNVRGIAHIMKKKNVLPADLDELDKRCRNLGPLFNALMEDLPEQQRINVDIPKVHAVMHFVQFIRLYGCALNFDTSTNERLHKEVVGNVMKQDCRRNADRLERMLRLVNKRTLLKVVKAYREVGVVSPARVAPAPMYLRDASKRTLAQFVDEQTDVAMRRRLRKAIRKFKKGSLVSQMAELKVWHQFVLDYGEERVVFVNSPNYRNTGPRRDFIGVRTLGRARPFPCEVLAYFGHETKPMALVRDFMFVTHAADSGGFEAAVVQRSPKTRDSAYAVVEAVMIMGHAHLVPVFDGVDAKASSKLFWFDDLTVI